MRKLTTLLIAVSLAACGLKTEANYEKMRGFLVSEKYSDAVSFIDGEKEKFYGETNALLYYFDRMMALHLAQRYKESNAVVEKASDKIEALYTQSVSKNVAAFMTNDNVLPFEGEEFEKVLIHVVGALNYTYLGDRDGALVEARRVEEKLTALNDRVLKGAKDEKDEAAKQRAQFSEDAFIRWFAGCLRETEGGQDAMNDALISYKKALDAYEKSYVPKYKTPTPMLLVQDLMRTAEAIQFDDDLAAVKKKFPSISYTKPADAQAKGQVVFIHMNGEAPYKIDKTWEAIADNKVIKVAYPEFVSKPKRIAYATIAAAGTTAKTEMMEDVNAIAIQSLKDRIGRVKAKMIARAIAKFLAAKAAEVAASKASGNSAIGSLFGAAASIAGAATEIADKRSWLLLPSSIDVATTYLPPGTHNVTVTYYSAGGGVVGTKQIPNVQVTAGKKVFLSARTF